MNSNGNTEGVGSQTAHQQRNLSQSKIEWDKVWYENPQPFDKEIWQFNDEATEWLAERAGIAVSPRLFSRMRDVGMGPYLPGVSVSDPHMIGRWASYAFDIPAQGPPPFDHHHVFAPILSNKSKSPSWLVAAQDGPQANNLVTILQSLGANIVRARNPLEAAQAVSALQLHGMIMRFNHRIEAEFAIAFICMEQAVPFIIITDGPERPATMARGGVVLHEPRSPYEVIAALETLPAARLVGLDLPDDGVVAAERR